LRSQHSKYQMRILNVHHTKTGDVFTSRFLVVKKAAYDSKKTVRFSLYFV